MALFPTGRKRFYNSRSKFPAGRNSIFGYSRSRDKMSEVTLKTRYAAPVRITPSLTSLRRGHHMPLPSCLTTERNSTRPAYAYGIISKAAPDHRSPRRFRRYHPTSAHRSRAGCGRQGRNNIKAETPTGRSTAWCLRRGHRLSRAMLYPKVFDHLCSRSG